MANLESSTDSTGVTGGMTVEDVVAEYESALLRYATRLVNDTSAAQDVVQDVFIKLCRGWRNGSHPGEQLRSWLFRVTHNAAVDYIRRESRLRVLHERQAEHAAVEAPAGQRRTLLAKETHALVLEHLRLLDPREQQVVVLRLQEGMSYREIADVTGRSEGNVGCILHHALKKLAASLKRAGIGPHGD
jgi:RNA polymerase sigma-70 factor (ECF subfamily)